MLHAGDVPQVSYAAVAAGGIGQISGLGGVGKSLLAEEYALRFGAAYPGGVFWLRAYGNDNADAESGSERREVLRDDQVRQMAERLGIHTHGLTAEQIEGELARKIASEGKACLWVVDDVPNKLNSEALRRWFAPHALARTLLTTRSGEYGSLTKGIDLSVLTPDEAFQLLTSRRVPAGKDEEEQAHDLARDLGYHALALDVTGSALMSYGGDEPYRALREELADQDEDALELSTELADALPNGHEASIMQTMLRSIRGLGAEGRDLLRVASVLAVAPLPASLVTEVFEKADGVERIKAEQRQRKGFHDVTKASLATMAGEKHDARSVHILVSRTVRFDEKSAPERSQVLRAATVKALLAEIAEAAEDPSLHKQTEVLVAHARHLVSIPESLSEADLVNSVARYDFTNGAYASARILWSCELGFRRREQGPEHPFALIVMGNLAASLLALRDSAGARKLLEESLEIRRRMLGPEHPDTLSATRYLAETVREQGNLLRARKLQEETLEVRRRVGGAEDPHTSVDAWNLFDTLASMGELDAALAILNRDLLWLVERDPCTLQPGQRQIRELVARIVGSIQQS